MFGFLRIAKKGLLKSDRALYNAHFCAACHTNAAFGGRLTSLLTSYDQTFLMLVFSALDEHRKEAPVMRPCTAFPLRRVAVQPTSATAGRLLAALNVSLVDAKLKDDVQDEGRLRSRLASRLLARRSESAREVLQAHDFPVDVIDRLRQRQSDAESSEQPDLTTLSTPTADVLAEIFGFVATLTVRPNYETTLRRLGEALGRFLYVWDALEDLKADQKAGRFNAIVASFGPEAPSSLLGRPDGPSGAPRLPAYEPAVRGILLQSLRHMERALDELPLGARVALTSQLIATLRGKVTSRLGEAAKPATCNRIAPNSWLPFGTSNPGWLHAMRRRAQLQRGDCDCGDCGGCDSCCECGDCCSGMSAQTFVILLIIVIIIIVIAFFASRNGSETAPTPSPSTTPAVTRSVQPSPASRTQAPQSPFASTKAAKGQGQATP